MVFGKVTRNDLNNEMSLNKIDLRLKLCLCFIVKIGLILFVSSNRSFKTNHPVLIWNEKVMALSL